MRKTSQKRCPLRQECWAGKSCGNSLLIKGKVLKKSMDNGKYLVFPRSCKLYRPKESSRIQKDWGKWKWATTISQTLPCRHRGIRGMMPLCLYQRQKQWVLQQWVYNTWQGRQARVATVGVGTKSEAGKEKTKNCKQNGWGPGPRKR